MKIETKGGFHKFIPLDGKVVGRTVVVKREVGFRETETVTIELTRGEIGLLHYHSKHEPDPVMGLVDKVNNEEFVGKLEETLAAIEKVKRLTNIRPVTSSDMGHLSQMENWLRSATSTIKTSVKAIKGTE